MPDGQAFAVQAGGIRLRAGMGCDSHQPHPCEAQKPVTVATGPSLQWIKTEGGLPMGWGWFSYRGSGVIAAGQVWGGCIPHCHLMGIPLQRSGVIEKRQKPAIHCGGS